MKLGVPTEFMAAAHNTAPERHLGKWNQRPSLAQPELSTFFSHKPSAPQPLDLSTGLRYFSRLLWLRSSPAPKSDASAANLSKA